MDMNTIASVLHALGLDNVLPVILALSTLARAIDALISQPAPGSHWIPMRKIVSFLSLGVGHAKPGEQPAFVTWLQRLVQALAQVAPPPPSPRIPPVITQPPAAVAADPTMQARKV